MSDLSINNGLAFRGSFYDKFIKSLPNKDIKGAEKLNKIGQALASPHWNRLTLGAAALTTQPLIDFYNPKVDKDTAIISSLRTMAKIIACTAVGFVVRGSCYKLANKYINCDPKEGSTLLTPKEILAETNLETKRLKLKLHKNAVSTITALSVMVFTNFLLDAPLTTKLANFFIGVYKNHKGEAAVK